MFVQIPELLNAVELQHCRALLERASWEDGRLTAGHQAARVKDNQQLGQSDPLVSQIGDLVLQKLSESGRFLSVALPLKVLPPRFNRYSGNGAYGDHVDAAIFSVPGTPARIRGDLSATLFFSEPDAYDGGELVIEAEGDRRQIKLPAGHMVLYPAGSLHRVTPVTRGARIAAFFWVQSLVREPGRRALLLELDETIQGLVETAPDHPAIVRLSGLYHNLLREWAVT
jgi:PKHD-type hydroxylase